MRKLVEQTGGRLFDVGDSAKKLRASLEQLSHELHDQYVLTYLPRRNLADGKFHHVEIKANDSDYRVLSRRGYWAPRDASAPAAESPAPTH